MTKKCITCKGEGPFPSRGEGRWRDQCVKCFNKTRREQHGRSPVKDEDLVRLRAAAKRNPTFEDLCDAMNMSPKACKALLAKAEKFGAPVHVEHGVISLAPARTLDTIQDITIRKPVGGYHSLLLISDTHTGSKYCLRNPIRDVVNWAYEQGVRDVSHSGDVVEGCYRHAQYELSHVGFDDQVRDAFNTFPQLPGLNYHFISGNHDYTFEEHTGMRCGQAIENGMRALGRDDWHCYGDRQAYVRIGGIIIDLWHPRGGGAYARSYNPQKKIESYTAIKPHLLQIGHYHQFCYVYERGIHAFQMPCFQGSGSNFAKSLKGSPAIGGIIVRWRLTETGRIHDLQFHPRFFFERDEVFNPRNELSMEEVKPQGHDRRYRKGRHVE